MPNDEATTGEVTQKRGLVYSDYYSRRIADCRGGDIPAHLSPVDIANAKKIVARWNSHKHIVWALEQAIEIITAYEDIVDDTRGVTPLYGATMDSIRATLTASGSLLA